MPNLAQASYCPPGDKVCRNGNYWVCSSDGGSYQKKECCGDGCKKETPKPQDDKKPGDNGTGDPNNQVIPPGANCPPGHRVCGSKGIYWYCQGGESYQETNPPQCCGSGCNTSGGASSNTNQCDQEGLWACANGKVMICRQKQWKTVDNNAAVCVDNSSTSCQAGQVKCDGKNMQKCVCNGNNCAWQVDKGQKCTSNPSLESTLPLAEPNGSCSSLQANNSQCLNGIVHKCVQSRASNIVFQWQNTGVACFNSKDESCSINNGYYCDKSRGLWADCRTDVITDQSSKLGQCDKTLTVVEKNPVENEKCTAVRQIICDQNNNLFLCNTDKKWQKGGECNKTGHMNPSSTCVQKGEYNCINNYLYKCVNDGNNPNSTFGKLENSGLQCGSVGKLPKCAHSNLSTCINGKAHKCENNDWKPIKENGKEVICADPNTSECKLGQSKCDNGVMKNCVCQGNNCSFQPYSTNNGANKCVTSINQTGGNNSGGSNNSGGNSGGSAGGSNNTGGGGGGTGGGTGIAPQNPTGYVDEVNGGACYITGWSCDANNPALPLQIDVYKTDLGPGNFVGATSTGLSRIDVAQAGRCNGNQNTGFLYQLPDQYKDGVQRTIHLHALGINADGTKNNTNPPLIGSPTTITCKPMPKDLKQSCASDGSNKVSLEWKGIPDAKTYAIRLDKENNCKNSNGDTVGWYCPEPDDKGLLGDRFVIVQASSACSDEVCRATVDVVAGAKYTGWNVQALYENETSNLKFGGLSKTGSVFACGNSPTPQPRTCVQCGSSCAWSDEKIACIASIDNRFECQVKNNACVAVERRCEPCGNSCAWKTKDGVCTTAAFPEGKACMAEGQECKMIDKPNTTPPSPNPNDPTLGKADFDGNGKVDQADLNLLIQKLYTTDCRFKLIPDQGACLVTIADYNWLLPKISQ